jgi:Taurine catabolism dioxygenase TauD, TfdA family
MYAMHLQPGDMQIINNHVTLHSRTEFEDFGDPARKRLLFRLWLAPPASPRPPESWRPAYRSVAPGTVRGGIVGQQHDDRCRAFEAWQAKAMGMPICG